MKILRASYLVAVAFLLAPGLGAESDVDGEEGNINLRGRRLPRSHPRTYTLDLKRQKDRERDAEFSAASVSCTPKLSQLIFYTDAMRTNVKRNGENVWLCANEHFQLQGYMTCNENIKTMKFYFIGPTIKDVADFYGPEPYYTMYGRGDGPNRGRTPIISGNYEFIAEITPKYGKSTTERISNINIRHYKC